jgi:hypothetical protein
LQRVVNAWIANAARQDKTEPRLSFLEADAPNRRPAQQVDARLRRHDIKRPARAEMRDDGVEHPRHLGPGTLEMGFERDDLAGMCLTRARKSTTARRTLPDSGGLPSHG